MNLNVFRSARRIRALEDQMAGLEAYIRNVDQAAAVKLQDANLAKAVTRYTLDRGRRGPSSLVGSV